MEIEEIMGEVEAFFARAAKISVLERSYDGGLEASNDKDVQNLCREHSLSPPEELLRFWKRGLQYQHVTLEGDEQFAAAGFDWVDAKLISRDLPILRGLTQFYEEGSDEKLIVDTGIVLTFGAPQIVWVPEKGIYHFSVRNPVRPPIAPTLTEFLYYWLEAGCFASHNYTAYLDTIQSILPGRVPPAENPWLKYYREQFG